MEGSLGLPRNIAQTSAHGRNPVFSKTRTMTVAYKSPGLMDFKAAAAAVQGFVHQQSQSPYEEPQSPGQRLL